MNYRYLMLVTCLLMSAIFIKTADEIISDEITSIELAHDQEPQSTETTISDTTNTQEDTEQEESTEDDQLILSEDDENAEDEIAPDEVSEEKIETTEPTPEAVPTTEEPATPLPATPWTPKTPAQLNAEINKIEEAAEPPEEDLIELYFENADLEQFVLQIETIFGITFIRDDSIAPQPEGAKTLKGIKISFRAHQPMSRQQAWNLFVTFLRLAGFSVIQESSPRIYRISPLDVARRSPLPTYIGTDPTQLPDNDQLVRYIYFVDNSSLDAMKLIVDPLKSSAATFLLLPDIKAFLLVDQAYNIKSLMRIVKELDRVNSPQAMSVLKLKRANAEEVEKLYKDLVPQEDKSIVNRLTAKRKSTAFYFPENTRIIAEPRTNALILLGSSEGIKRIEQFITQYVDIEIDNPYTLLQVHTLKYASAKTIADIMNAVTQFGKDTPAGRVGGVRSGDKFLRDMTFTPEDKTNRLIIRGEYEDYLKVKEIIDQLDQEAAQVAIEVLVLSIDLKEARELGAQLRSNQNNGFGLLGNNIKFQTSGLRAGGVAKGIVPNPSGNGVQRLLGDLINLVTNAPAGNTVISLGQDAFGVWGIFDALQTITNTQILANPFFVATNKTTATIKNGETRRVVTATVIGTTDTQTLGDDTAELKVTATPQINSDGMIILQLNVELSAFTSPASDNVNVQKTIKNIETETIVSDREVLALGGLIENEIDHNESKTPILGDIPILGWLFKNKRKEEDKSTLLILVSSHIIEPHSEEQANQFTQERIRDYRGMLNPLEGIAENRDPVHRYFFADSRDSNANAIDNFIFERHAAERNKKKPKIKKRSRRVRRSRHKKGISTKPMVVQNQAPEPAIQQPELIMAATTAPAASSEGTQPLAPAETPLAKKQIAQRARPKRSLADLMTTEQTGVTT